MNAFQHGEPEQEKKPRLFRDILQNHFRVILVRRRQPLMKTTLLILCLLAVPLSFPRLLADEISAEMAETFRNYIKISQHVVLVCDVQKTAKTAEKPGAYHEIHVTATVVRPIKGKGTIGDRLHYYILCEERIPPAGLEVGGLTFLMLSDYGLDEFLLGAGDGWRYTPTLDALLGTIKASNK